MTSPFGHPHVWRGAERYCRELAAWLGQQGHEATWLVTTPDHTTTATLEPDGVRVHYQHRSPDRGRASSAVALDPLLRCVPPLVRSVRQFDFDVIQTHHYVDAAAVRLASHRRTPYVMWIPGVPRRASLAGRPMHKAAFRVGAAGARQLYCLSEFARDSLRADFAIDAEVMRPGVDTQRYAGERSADEPVILCAAAPGDPRKRVELLVAAFPTVLERIADAVLVLASHDPGQATALLDGLPPAARHRARVAANPDFDELAALYRGAAVSVLPSVDEAFGLVIVESLAAGTPVVASDRGAPAEIISDDGVGRLFAHDQPDALAGAILDAIELSADPSTAARCRAHASHWDWSKVGPELEEIYRGLL